MEKHAKCAFQVIEDLGAADLTAKQFFYLETIDKTPDLTTSQFAKLLNITKPSVTEIINKLHKAGCIYRKKDPNDGRVHFIELTDKGKKVARYKSLAQEDLAIEICDVLTDREANQFMEFLIEITKDH
ncbi:MarR family transcriptional regulator [Endozoicomonas gorgoniicola]|uniref:MarR family transcriptional regulator n=1 Tax=Endozoicomonas gorgoniicola TaxID=1234144 RepID=A0ABT3MSP7_9GAMM|nr:MarR family transcriptional regulator [Endozoicomonas gorgoniicola]MCW7552372.1 MarR family transcriptional regulator [Endozoicomonas gorgoniicola]